MKKIQKALTITIAGVLIALVFVLGIYIHRRFCLKGGELFLELIAGIILIVCIARSADEIISE